MAYPSAIDQWCMRHAARLAARPPERVVIDTANPMVLSLHLLCAAGEQPLSSADASLFPRGLFESVVTDLQRKEKLFPIPLPSRGGRKGGSREGASGACGEEREQGAGLEGDAMETDDGRGSGEGIERGECGIFEWRPDVLNGSAVEACNLRSIDPKRVEVLLHTRKRRTQRAISEAWGQGEEEGEDGEQVVEVIDEVEQWRVYYELFEGAIYFNQGRKVKVTHRRRSFRPSSLLPSSPPPLSRAPALTSDSSTFLVPFLRFQPPLSSPPSPVARPTAFPTTARPPFPVAGDTRRPRSRRGPRGPFHRTILHQLQRLHSHLHSPTRRQRASAQGGGEHAATRGAGGGGWDMPASPGESTDTACC